MKHIFIDTDIVIDFLSDRMPFNVQAATIFDKADKREIKLYTSSNTITNTHYLLSKFVSEIQIRKLIYELIQFVYIIPVTKDVIQKAIESNFKDFEDAVQYFCAKSQEQIECIITRNTNDYKTSKIPVYHPDVLIK